ncbi:hypothetical protein V6N13_139297 [Hibiscus sabdariffa]
MGFSGFFAAAVMLIFFVGCFMAVPEVVAANHGGVTRHYKFNVCCCHCICFSLFKITCREVEIRMKNITRLCRTKSIVAVNGKFPGPRVVAREGDRLVVKVVNHVSNNITVHWYESEWFNADPEAVINQSLQTGAGPNVSDAYTLNGLPGPLYNCSAKDAFKLKVKPGKTYLLRLINAALNDELFFRIANHSFTVVEADASYLKPFETDILVIAPGQTTNVLLKTKSPAPNATFFMLARPYATGMGTFDNTTVAGILEYENPSSSSLKTAPLLKPDLPAINATNVVANFSNKFRSLATTKFPANVPQKVEKKFFFTVGLGSNPCPKNQTCQGPNGTKFAASMNNISFALPSTALLQSYFFSKSNGVFTTDFPDFPLHPFNYTGTPPNNTHVINGTTKVEVIAFNTSVEVVLQDTSILGAESHPLHLHGYNFYVVGQGFGNFDPKNDPPKFNLVDPVERNTVGVPSGGWVAIRFQADNPGVWLMHCHFDVHLSWGLRMAWIVLDGKLPNQKLPPPPSDLPKC